MFTPSANTLFSRYTLLSLLALLTLLALLLGLPPDLSAAERQPDLRIIRSTEVLSLAMDHNPSLRATLLEIDREQAAVTAAEGLYPWYFGADAGYVHASTPQGNSRYFVRDQVTVGTDLAKTFSAGTLIDFRLEGSWYETSRAYTGTVDQRPGGVPNYGFLARLALTQPLIRGRGPQVTLAPLRQARAQHTLARSSADLESSRLARDVLLAYWDLWLSSRTVDINRQSREVARQQLAETTDRVALGAAAPIEELSYRTRLAALNETVIESESEEQRLSIRLSQTIGQMNDSTRFRADTDEPLPHRDETPSQQDTLQQALDQSLPVRQAFVTLEVAQERTIIAGESMRQRLDLQGWIAAQTLGENELPPVVTDLGTTNAWSVWIGLRYEVPLDNRRKEGERAVARLDVDIAARRLQAVRNTVQGDTLVALDRHKSARARFMLSNETLALAQDRVAAERDRYQLGASTFTTIRDAEETLREAELRQTRAQVDIAKARIHIDHLTGHLLKTVPRQ